MDDTTLKILLSVAMFVLTVICGTLPIKIIRLLRRYSHRLAHKEDDNREMRSVTTSAVNFSPVTSEINKSTSTTAERALIRNSSPGLQGYRNQSTGAPNRNPNAAAHESHHNFQFGRSKWPSLTLCLLTCFSGGVFLGTCFLHLLPEVTERWEIVCERLNYSSEYPFPQLISCLGFFFLYFVEEVFVSFLRGDSHAGHTHFPVPVQTSSPKTNRNDGTDRALITTEANLTGGGRSTMSPPASHTLNAAMNFTEMEDVEENEEIKEVLKDADERMMIVSSQNEENPPIVNDNVPRRSAIKRQAVNKSLPLHIQSPCEPPNDIPNRYQQQCPPHHRNDDFHRSSNQCVQSPPVIPTPLCNQRASSVDMAYFQCASQPCSNNGSIMGGVAEPERCEPNLMVPILMRNGQRQSVLRIGSCNILDKDKKYEEDPPIVIGSKPHLHSHGVRSITLALAVGFHAVVEGMAFGIAEGQNAIWRLFVALLIHKLVVIFGLGLQLARTHSHKTLTVFATIVVLAFSSPLGAFVGIGIVQSAIENTAKEILLLILEGSAVGTFLYVTFFEVLIHERDNEHPSLIKLLAILIGFSCIACLRLIGHSHGGEQHGHGHEHNDGHGHGHNDGHGHG